MNREYADKLHIVIPKLISEGHITLSSMTVDAFIMNMVIHRTTQASVLDKMINKGTLSTTVVPVEECTETRGQEIEVLFHAWVDTIEL